MQIHPTGRQEEKPDEPLQNLDGSPVFLLVVIGRLFTTVSYAFSFLMISLHAKLDNLELSLQRVDFISNSQGKTQTARCYIVN